MDIIQRSIRPHRALLRRIRGYSRDAGVELYLVGGFLRDVYCSRRKPEPDFDFCMRRGALRFGKGLAQHLKCGFVVLDKEHGCCRLVVRDGATYTVDIADFRGPTLAEDLALRDFSVNSICVALQDLTDRSDPSTAVVDLYGGRLDIKRKRLRIMYCNAFDDDPLRVLRAFSLSAVFGFSIDPGTLRGIRRARKLLSRVSGERVRDELFKIFETPGAGECLAALDAHAILGIVFPEIRAMKRVRKAGKASIDVWGHTIDTIVRLEELCGRLRRNADIAAYLDAPVAGGRSMYSLLKLVALLHDAGKPRTFKYEQGKLSFYGHERVGSKMAVEICRRLKLSNDEQRRVSRITFLHLRPGYMATMAAVTSRAIFRFFRDAGAESVAVLLLALADERATSGYEVVEKIRPRYERLISRLVKLYFERQKAAPRKRLVTGHDIMRLGSLPPSELIGRILKDLEEVLAVKGITSRAQALQQAATLIEKTKAGQKRHG